jgi:hypothetical protein
VDAAPSVFPSELFIVKVFWRLLIRLLRTQEPLCGQLLERSFYPAKASVDEASLRSTNYKYQM